MVLACHEAFLIERTRNVRHGSRPFYLHLKGVHDLLRDWGAAEHVCYAGLFHSIYGTRDFRMSVLDRNSVVDRCELLGLIGAAAERLVLRFCDEAREVARDAELAELEVANLIEQGANFPPWLLVRFGRLPLSDGARLHLLVASGWDDARLRSLA